MNDTSRKTGFTLIEILIAIVIFAIVITTLFSTFSTFLATGETVKENLAFSQSIQNVLGRIHLDLEAVFVTRYPEYKKPEFNSQPDPYRFIGEDTGAGQQMISFLSFASLAHTALGPEGRHGIARISYYLKENDSGLFTLYRSDRLLPAPVDENSCRDPVLCTDISEFAILYTDINGDEYRFWDSESGNFEHTLPVQVHFSITMHSGKSQKQITTKVNLNNGRLPID